MFLNMKIIRKCSILKLQFPNQEFYYIYQSGDFLDWYTLSEVTYREYRSFLYLQKYLDSDIM